MSAPSTQPIKCLLCPKKLVIRDLNDHLHAHLEYKPLKCRGCDFETTAQHLLDSHTFDYSHDGYTVQDPYKEYLLNLIRNDIKHAARSGLAALMRTKDVGASSSPAAAAAAAARAAVRPAAAGPSQHRPAAAGAAKHPEPPSVVDSSSDSDEDPFRPQQAAEEEEEEDTPPPPRRRTIDNSPPSSKKSALAKKKKEETEESEEEDDIGHDDKHLRELRKKMSRYVQCGLCREKVKISYAERRFHVESRHIEDRVLPHMPSYVPELERQIKHAFPNMTTRPEQCELCDAMNAVHNEASRPGHVASYNHYARKLKCPHCNFSSAVVNVFSAHFHDVHAISDWKREWPEWKPKYLAHQARLKIAAGLVFSGDLRGGRGTTMAGAPGPRTPANNRRPAQKKRSRKNGESDEDSDEDRAMLEEIKRTTAALNRNKSQPAAKKRRSKTPSSSSSDSDDDSDDEKKKKAAKKAEKKKKQKESEAKEEEEEGEEEDDSPSTEVSAGAQSVPNDEIKSETGAEVNMGAEEEEQQVIAAVVAAAAAAAPAAEEAPKPEPPETPKGKPLAQGPPAVFPGRIYTDEHGLSDPSKFPDEARQVELRRQQRANRGRGGDRRYSDSTSGRGGYNHYNSRGRGNGYSPARGGRDRSAVDTNRRGGGGGGGSYGSRNRSSSRHRGGDDRRGRSPQRSRHSDSGRASTSYYHGPRHY